MVSSSQLGRPPGLCVIITRELVSTRTASWRVRQVNAEETPIPQQLYCLLVLVISICLLWRTTVREIFREGWRSRVWIGLGSIQVPPESPAT